MCDFHPDYFMKAAEAAEWLKKETGAEPVLAIALTGGIDFPAKSLQDGQEVSAQRIPHFPLSRAEGHEGKILFGTLHGRKAAILKGRCHFYEGHSAQQVVFPYFVLKEMGILRLITTNSAGGIHPRLQRGDIMLIKDQINAMGVNPLRGIAVQRRDDQFIDMTACFDPACFDAAREEADRLGIPLREGVYAGTQGPCYETPSEVRAFRAMGADAVGMSTVLEVIACRFLGISVLGFSLITNEAADHHPGAMHHEEVLKEARKTGPRLVSLVEACCRRL